MSSTVVYLSMMSEEHTMQMWSNVVLNVHEMWNPKDVFDDHYETGDGPQGLTYCGICLANRWQMPHHFHFPSNTRRIISKSLKTCFEIEEFKMLGLCSRTALQDSRNRQRIIKPAVTIWRDFGVVSVCSDLRHALHQIVGTTSSRRQSGTVLRWFFAWALMTVTSLCIFCCHKMGLDCR